MIAAKKAVDEGLAYYDDEGNLVYIDPNDPDAPVDPDDPQNPDDPENPDNPQNPDTPQNPDDPNSGTGEQTGGETGGQTGEGETGTGTGEQTGGQAGAESGEQTSGETGTGGEGQITEPPAEPDQPTGPAEPNVNNGQQ